MPSTNTATLADSRQDINLKWLLIIDLNDRKFKIIYLFDFISFILYYTCSKESWSWWFGLFHDQFHYFQKSNYFLIKSMTSPFCILRSSRVICSVAARRNIYKFAPKTQIKIVLWEDDLINVIMSIKTLEYTFNLDTYSCYSF